MLVSHIGKDIEGISPKKLADETDSQYFSAEQARQLRPLFRFLNDKDRDILYLFFVSRKKQMDVRRILRRGQSALSYDIHRIRRRLRFISYLHSVFDIFVNFITAEKARLALHPASAPFDEQELGILTLMFYTSSFTLTAKIMKISQVKVRYIYNRCLRKMEDHSMWEPYEVFGVIRANLNIIRRICKRQLRKPVIPIL